MSAPLPSDPALARLALRVECLKAATVIRTPGTQPADTLAIANEFWRWVSAPPADNRKPPAR